MIVGKILGLCAVVLGLWDHEREHAMPKVNRDKQTLALLAFHSGLLNLAWSESPDRRDLDLHQLLPQHLHPLPFLLRSF